MPTSHPRRRPRLVTVDDAPAQAPMEAVRRLADALCRAATECAHQHDRFARLLETEATLPTEEMAAQEICGVCDHTIAELAAAYERAAAASRSREAAPDWWNRANSLWLACRDYARHHEDCDQLTRKLRGRHTPQELWQLEIEFELEASALLALRHSCATYRRAAESP